MQLRDLARSSGISEIATATYEEAKRNWFLLTMLATSSYLRQINLHKPDLTVLPLHHVVEMQPWIPKGDFQVIKQASALPETLRVITRLRQEHSDLARRIEEKRKRKFT